MILNTRLRDTIISQIKSIDPSIDLNEGSTFRDLIISPLSVIFERMDSQLSTLLNKLSNTSLEDADDEDIDRVGANFLLSRDEGSEYTGKVRFYYTTPAGIFIPRGLRLTASNGVVFEVVSEFSFSRFSLSLNVDGAGLYYTPEILVKSVEKVANAELATNALLKITSNLTSQPQKVVVTTAITGGSPRESNEAFIKRIKSSVSSTSLASLTAIEAGVKLQNSYITDILAVGSGSLYMKRDLVGYDLLVQNVIEDFKYTKSAVGDDALYKPHKAYLDNFTSVVENSRVALPVAPSEWETEFTDEQYKGIFSLSNNLSATSDQYQIVSDDGFTSDSLLG